MQTGCPDGTDHNGCNTVGDGERCSTHGTASHIADGQVSDFCCLVLERSLGARNNTLRLQSLPNPYPMPDSPYSLDFAPPGRILPRNNVVACLFTVRLELHAHIRSHRKHDEFKGRDWLCAQENIVFAIKPPVLGRATLTFGDAYQVLDAFALKMGQDGYRSLWAQVLTTQGGIYVGNARIGSHEVK